MPRGIEFEWDRDKERSNVAKHGVAFLEAIAVFGDPREVVIFDPDHSRDEDRFVSIGLSDRGRLLVVSYTERSRKTRIISARRATRHEEATYNQAGGGA